MAATTFVYKALDRNGGVTTGEHQGDDKAQVAAQLRLRGLTVIDVEEKSSPLTFEAIGALLYGKYLFLFEAAGIILLVAMIGAIVLTHRQRSGVRPQNVSEQIARRPDEATINVQPEVGKGVTL